MGIGTPEYILEAVQNGVDMFDCVFPTLRIHIIRDEVLISSPRITSYNVCYTKLLRIFGANQKASLEAKAAVLGIAQDPEVGIVYQGTVKRVMDFGAFVEILPSYNFV